MKSHSVLGLVLLLGLAAPALAQNPAASFLGTPKPASIEALWNHQTPSKLQQIFTSPVTDHHVMKLWDLAKPLL